MTSQHEINRSTTCKSFIFGLLVPTIAAFGSLGSSQTVGTMEFLAFFWHYVAYLSSPGGVLALFLVLPLLHIIWSDSPIRALRRTPSPSASTTIPGCVRYGLCNRSNLDDQYETSYHALDGADDAKSPQVKAIFAYPIKSCKGIELPAAEVTATGLLYDRFLSFAQLVSSRKTNIVPNAFGFEEVATEWDHQWRFITQREFPRLALIETELWIPDPRGMEEDVEQGSTDRVNDWRANGGCLVVQFPYRESGGLREKVEMVTLRIPLDPTVERAEAKEYEVTNMTIWRDCPQAIDVSNEIDPNVTKHRGASVNSQDQSSPLQKLRCFLGVRNPLGLFRVDRTSLRKITRSLPQDRSDEIFQVGFADAFPIHILNLASSRAIDEDMPMEATSKSTLDVRRFRANFVVTGPPAFSEDRWKMVQIGLKVNRDGSTEPGQYHAACRTARCVLVNVDQDTGIKDRREPVSTLQRTRLVDEGAKPHPCLGLSMIPLFDRGVIRIGDKVGVMETGQHYYEKMFA